MTLATPLLLAALGTAIAPPPPRLDLPLLAQQSLRHAPRVAAARAQAAAQRLRAELDRPDPFPLLRAGARLWPYTAGADGVARTRYRVYGTLRLPLLDAIAYPASQALVTTTARKGEVEAQVARAQVLREVALAYATAHAAWAARPAYDVLLDVRRRELQVAEARLRAGMSLGTEVAQAQQDLQGALAAQDEADRAGQTARAQIHMLTGWDVGSMLLLPPDAGAGETPPNREPNREQDREAAATRAARRRLEVQVERAEAARLEARAGIAWRETVEVDVTAGYSLGNTGALDELSGFSIGLEVGGRLDGVQRARRRRDSDLCAAQAARHVAEALAQQVAAEARLAHDALQRARGLLAVAQARVESAERDYEDLRSRQALVTAEQPAVPMPQLLQAEAALRLAEVQRTEARGQEELAYVQLMLAQGDDPAERSAPASDVIHGEGR